MSHPTTPLFKKSQHPQGQSQVSIGSVTFGGNAVPIIAGPCAVESAEQLMEVALTLKALGIGVMRAGAFKPRTTPYSFQGMGVEGLELLAETSRVTGVAVISEVLTIEQVSEAAPFLDAFQVGARNMHNFELLKALGRQDKPVLLKRGLSATVDEFLWAAEYIMAEGNMNVILCERGIRSFDSSATRNVLDLGAVALIKELTHLPIIVDPSHATGKRTLVTPCAKAGVAVGADGLIVEAHPIPEKSVSDASQALSMDDLCALVHAVQPVATAVGRQIHEHAPNGLRSVIMV